MYIELEKPIEGYTHAKIGVHYQLGGVNYGTYKQENRGYYIHFTLCNFCDENGDTVTKYYSLFGTYSFKIFVLPVNRQSKSKQIKLERIIKRNINSIVDKFINKDFNNLAIQLQCLCNI